MSMLPRRFGIRLVATIASTAIVSGALLTGAPAAHAAPATPALRSAATEKQCAMTKTAEYQRATPAEVGLDPVLVQRALALFTLNGAETVKVFRHGCLVGEGALDAAFNRVPRLNWSQTKTVASLIAGVAVRKGLIDVDDPIGKYLPAGMGDAAHRAVTIRQVLNMTTGFRMNWVRGLNLVGDISRAREAMAAEMVHKPGTYYEYDQTTPSLLTYVVQRAIWQQIDPKLDYQDWAQKHFFNKLGIPLSAWFWMRDRSGNSFGYSKLFLRPLEFGRLGELMLNKGVYDGVRIIDERYMNQLQRGSRANCAYGYMVWLNSCQPGQKQVNGSIFARREFDPARPLIASAPRDMYYTWGYHGQHTFVIPSLDMIVTRSGELPPDTVEKLLGLDPDAAIAGEQGQTYYKFFRHLMNSVQTMPAGVDIAEPRGSYDDPTALNFDADSFIYPIDTAAGSYLGIGPSAPVGCTLLGCVDEPNDGTTATIHSVPRVIPGILGNESRPNG